MQTNSKILLAFGAGFIAGKNEEEIRKLLLPFLRLSDEKLQSGYSSIISFFLQHKEFVEDLFAESQAETPPQVENLEGGNGAARWVDSVESK